jgi:hypothetical protein
MVAMTWKREGKGSGPGNVLNGRYEVRRIGSRWQVVDRRIGPSMGNALWRTMRQARAAAERTAQR